MHESRVNNWRNKFLSLVGRLQLIRSVLSSMHIDWASVFILPSCIVHDLEQLMRGFLWCQGEMKKGKAKVAWDSVCMPKHEGSLGIRRIEDSNIALMATHIWSIFTHRESLWVKFVHTYKLNGRSFWDVPCRGDASWGWRKILQIRSTIRPFIWHKINNGKSTSVWFNRWTDVCPLKDLLSNWDIRDRDGVLQPFSVACVWDTIRSRANMVYWYNVVWFSHCIPRHAIHMWLVIQQKLKTQDRLRQWDVGPSIDLNLLKCPLCDLVPDSHDHLFFECSFSSQVWSKVRVLCGMDAIPPHLSDVVAFIVPLSKGKTVISIISRIVVAATSYYIWLERNGRLFKKKTSTPGQIVDVIFSTVRLKLVTFKFKKMSTKSRLLLDQWKIPSYCIVHDGSTSRDIGEGSGALGNTHIKVIIIQALLDNNNSCCYGLGFDWGLLRTLRIIIDPIGSGSIIETFSSCGCMKMYWNLCAYGLFLKIGQPLWLSMGSLILTDLMLRALADGIAEWFNFSSGLDCDCQYGWSGLVAILWLRLNSLTRSEIARMHQQEDEDQFASPVLVPFDSFLTGNQHEQTPKKPIPERVTPAPAAVLTSTPETEDSYPSSVKPNVSLPSFRGDSWSAYNTPDESTNNAVVVI
ncbi:putative gag-pol polyprotein [Tanacetum coccineum]